MALRDYFQNLKPKDKGKEVKDFIHEFDDFFSDIEITHAKELSPDSFVWRLWIDKKIYYLYAEDSIQDAVTNGLEYAEKQIRSISTSKDVEMIKVRNRQKWEEASPVRAAAVYTPPDKPEEMMKYAATSELDFAFLAITGENYKYKSIL